MRGRQTEMQGFFLGRLQRLARLAAVDPSALDRVGSDSMPEAEVREGLLHRAIFSTYLDCVQQGVEAEAREILERIRVVSA